MSLGLRQPSPSGDYSVYVHLTLSIHGVQPCQGKLDCLSQRFSVEFKRNQSIRTHIHYCQKHFPTKVEIFYSNRHKLFWASGRLCCRTSTPPHGVLHRRVNLLLSRCFFPIHSHTIVLFQRGHLTGFVNEELSMRKVNWISLHLQFYNFMTNVIESLPFL